MTDAPALATFPRVPDAIMASFTCDAGLWSSFSTVAAGVSGENSVA